MARIINPFEQFFDSNGEPLVNGLLDFFQSGSSTIRKDTFADAGETIANANPVVLNGDGRAPNVFGSGTYRVIVRDSSGSQIQQRDPVGGSQTSLFGSDWVSTIIYSISDVVRDEDIYWTSVVNDNIGNKPSEDNGTNWVEAFNTIPDIESGTSMFFAQTNAPVGWTKSTDHDNKAIRIVSGAASVGGSVGFTAAFSSQSVTGTTGNTAPAISVTVNNHTLTSSQSGLVSHDHISGVGQFTGFSNFYGTATPGGTVDRPTGQVNDSVQSPRTENISGASASAGHNHTASASGTNHSHTFSGNNIDLDVLYVDSIIAVRD